MFATLVAIVSSHSNARFTEPVVCKVMFDLQRGLIAYDGILFASRRKLTARRSNVYLADGVGCKVMVDY